MTLQPIPVRIRGDVVAGVGRPVAAINADLFAADVRKRIEEVLAAASPDAFLSVYVCVDGQKEPPRQDHPVLPTRVEDV